MILPDIRDRRFITVRRGGTLSDGDHRLLAAWAAECALHAAGYFEAARPGDDRPGRAVEAAYAWVAGDISVRQACDAAGGANAAARRLPDAARFAALSAGQAAAVAHVAAHELGAAAYAIRAAMAASEGEHEAARLRECRWQLERLPEPIRELVIDDERLRNDICWRVFG
jgi:hypothetical protein